MGRRREPTQEEILEAQKNEIKEALEVGKTELDFRTDSPELLRELCEIKTLKKN